MELVAKEERERLVDAFIKVVSERGSAEITAGDVTREANLPPATFARHFSDTRLCFIAAYDCFHDRLLAEIEDSITPQAPWPEQVRAGIHAAVSFVMESAAIARVFVVEGPSLGPPMINRNIAAVERIVSLLRRGRRRSEAAAALPSLSEAVLVAGAFSLVTAALLAEEQAELPILEEELLEVALMPLALELSPG